MEMMSRPLTAGGDAPFTCRGLEYRGPEKP
jgi:hypothetical protein